MMLREKLILAAVLAAGVMLAACGSGDAGDDETPASGTATAARTSARTPAVTRTVAASGDGTETPASAAVGETPSGASSAPPDGTGATGGSGVVPPPPPPPAPAAPPPAPVFTIGQAQSLLAAASLKPADLPGAWVVMSDTTQDNAAAAQANPEQAASNERCGRLLSRTVVHQPQDLVSAFISGQSLSFFSFLTVYATAGGAIDCAAENAGRLQQPGELARAFGSVFVDPAAVQVAPVNYPQVGQGSFAATLTGKISAQGSLFDLTILVVGFLDGNVTAAVGSARSGSVPPTAELTPLINLTLDRIRASQ